MKRFFLLCTIMLSCIILSAQVPSTFNYQGIARDEKGQPYVNKQIGIKIQIRDKTPAGTVLYMETRTVTTNAQGLFTVLINSLGADSQLGSFEDWDWTRSTFFLETLIDVAKNNTYVSIGTTRIVSVPFAMAAKDLEVPFYKSVSGSAPIVSLNNNGTGSSLEANSSMNHAVNATTNSTIGYAAVSGNATAAGGLGVHARAVAGGTALKVSGAINIMGPGQVPAAGKVLTSDANGNATWQNPMVGSAFRASGLKGNASQPIVPLTWKKVTFYEIDRYDVSDEYDAANSLFFPKQTGIYHLDAQITWYNECKQGRIKLKLLRAGVMSDLATDIQGINNSDHPLTQITNKVSIDIMLQKDDAVWVEAYNEGIPEGMIWCNLSRDGFATWFSGHLIQKL